MHEADQQNMERMKNASVSKTLNMYKILYNGTLSCNSEDKALVH